MREDSISPFDFQDLASILSDSTGNGEDFSIDFQFFSLTLWIDITD
jgi:hypothetical protein